MPKNVKLVLIAVRFLWLKLNDVCIYMDRIMTYELSFSKTIVLHYAQYLSK